jgi:hypothetical protein
MPLSGSRNPNSDATSAASFPITRGLAVVVLLALLILVALRHLFGSIRVEVGTR